MAGKRVSEQKPENLELLQVLLSVTGAQTVQRWLGTVIPPGKEHSRSYGRN